MLGVMTGMGLLITPRACVDLPRSSGERYERSFACYFIMDCLRYCPNQTPLIQSIHESVKANRWVQSFLVPHHRFWFTVDFIAGITDVLHRVRMSQMPSPSHNSS